MSRRKKYILCGFAVIMTAALLTDYYLENIQPFTGADFNQNTWKRADIMKCNRAPMTSDLIRQYLATGASGQLAADNMGAPFCGKKGFVDYALGLCHYRNPSKMAMLRLYYNPDATIAQTRIYWTTGTMLPVSPNAPTFDNPDISESPDIAWATGTNGVKYAINAANQLVIRSPDGKKMFLKDFKNGMAGINVLDIEACLQ